MEIQRRLGMAGTSNSTGSASSSPRNHRRRGHRRQMSDPKIFSSISPIKEDKDLEKELERVSWVLILRSSRFLSSSVCSSAWHIFHCAAGVLSRCSPLHPHCITLHDCPREQDLMERDLCAVNVEDGSCLSDLVPESEKGRGSRSIHKHSDLSCCVLFLAFLLLFYLSHHVVTLAKVKANLSTVIYSVISQCMRFTC